MKQTFLCKSVTTYDNGFSEANLKAVYDSNKENNQFALMVPDGEMRIGMVKGSSAEGYLKQGKLYVIDIKEREE